MDGSLGMGFGLLFALCSGTRWLDLLSGDGELLVILLFSDMYVSQKECYDDSRV